MYLIPEQHLETPYQSALALYAKSPSITVDVKLGNVMIPVPAALVNADTLSPIFGGERYAATIGGMFFISNETPEKYRHFAAFHELAEHAASRGFDETCLATHFQAIAVELGYAKATLNQDDFAKYCTWREGVERTNFFKLKENGLIDDIVGRINDIFKSIPQYITYRRKSLVQLLEE